MSNAGLWLPKHLRPANKPVKTVFYWNRTIDRIMVGFPEEFTAPKGFQKIVCQSAAEVDKWSQKMREQDRRDQEMTDEQREDVEGPMRAYARQELHRLMANAKNNLNREFCRQALQNMDDDAERKRMKRISFMHSEGFEDGK